MRNIICILFAALASLGAAAQAEVRGFDELCDCDLLFHVPDDKNNITDVTSADGRIATDHVAIFFRFKDVPLVIDATRRGVCIRRADSLAADGGRYVSVRVRDADAGATLRNALKFLGAPYDYKFYADDSEIYCSELVQKSFVDEKGRRMFTTIPMSFHDASGKITDYWKEYYRSRWNLPVPEGEEGTNPADMYVQALRMR